MVAWDLPALRNPASLLVVDARSDRLCLSGLAGLAQLEDSEEYSNPSRGNFGIMGNFFGFSSRHWNT
jgi:hypothetical protein